MTIQILYILLLLLLSAVFSGTETAFTSLTFIQEKDLQSGNGRTGKLAAALAKKPEVLLSTILIGNNLVNIAASAITTSAVIRYYGNYAVGISTGILTLVILIFAEITPKQIAIIHNETFSPFLPTPFVDFIGLFNRLFFLLMVLVFFLPAFF